MIPKQGYLQETFDINKVVAELEFYIVSIPEKITKLSSGELLQRPAPGKWSKKEIVGHLIDSAINNLKRFTEIPFLPQPYTIVSYSQNELVAANNYQNLPLDHLLNLWQALNRQIVFAVKNIPAEKLNYPVDPKYDNGEIKTLGWVIADYVAHMEHHFRQIFPGQ